MRGDERVRHCLHCHLDVYDLSALTRVEAENLLATREGICVTLLKRHDGTVVTQDCVTQRASLPHECAPLPTPVASPALASAPAPGPPRAPSAPSAPAPAPRAPAPAPSAPAKPSPPAPAALPPRRPPNPPEPTVSHPPPPMRLGGAPPPNPPTPVTWETVDPRIGRGTLLADLVRAIRAALSPEDADRRIRDVERALETPAHWQRASCARPTKCPLWIPGGADPVAPEHLKVRVELVAALEPIARAAFSGERVEILLREVRRTAFAGSRGGCPHCHAFIGLPPMPPPTSPPIPGPPR